MKIKNIEDLEMNLCAVQKVQGIYDSSYAASLFHIDVIWEGRIFEIGIILGLIE